MTQSPARMFAAVFGAVYLVVGVVGFAVTGFDGWLETNSGDFLLWFEINPLHNVVHLLIGAALLAGSARPSAARMIALTVAVIYAAVGVIGFWAVGEEWNILSLNQADNWLHIVTAVLALGAVAMDERRTADAVDRADMGRRRERTR